MESDWHWQKNIFMKEGIDYELWNAGEWQEVLVPQGVYEIGVDIPAGHWSISVDPNQGEYNQDIRIVWGTELDVSKKKISYSSEYADARIFGIFSTYYDVGDLTEVDYELREGTYLTISGGNVIFKPYIGKPSLGFK